MPDANDLLALADLEAHYNIAPGGADEPYLSSAITRASYDFYTYASRGAFGSALARGYANEFLGVQSYVGRFNGYNTNAINLPVYPVFSVTSLVANDQTIVPSPDGVAYGYLFDEDEVQLVRGKFYRGFQNVSVSWTAGYTVPPPDLVGAVELLVMSWYNRRKHIDVESETVNEQTRRYSGKKYPAEVEQTFERYRRKFPWS